MDNRTEPTGPSQADEWNEFAKPQPLLKAKERCAPFHSWMFILRIRFNRAGCTFG